MEFPVTANTEDVVLEDVGDLRQRLVYVKKLLKYLLMKTVANGAHS